MSPSTTALPPICPSLRHPSSVNRSAQFADDFAGGVGAAGARQAVARMRARATEKEPANRRLVARPIENRTHGEELVQCEFAVKNMAAGESVASFQVFRRDDLNPFHEA